MPQATSHVLKAIMFAREQQQTWKYDIRPTESKQLVKMVVQPSICRRTAAARTDLTMHFDHLIG